MRCKFLIYSLLIVSILILGCTDKGVEKDSGVIDEKKSTDKIAENKVIDAKKTVQPKNIVENKKSNINNQIQLVNPNSNGVSVGLTDVKVVLPLSNIPLQEVGKPFQDSTFGTTLIRLGDANPGELFRHEYSQLQAFNKESSLVLLNTAEGLAVYDVNTLAKVYSFNFPVNAPRWNPINPDEMIDFDENGDASSNGNVLVVLQKTNVRTGVTENIFTFPSEYERVAGSNSWEELSRDGKWLAAYLERSDRTRDIVAFNLESKKIGAVLTNSGGFGRNSGSCLEASQYEPNWVAASPLGNYLVVQWNRDGLGVCEGVEVFDIEEGDYLGHVASHRGHSDTGIDENGKEIYVTTSFSNDLLITLTEFPGRTGFSAPETAYGKIILSPGWYHMDHLSCKGPKGICVVSGGYGENGKPGDEPFSDEV